MDTDKIREEVSKVIEELLEKYAAAGVEKDVEDALNTAKETIAELTNKVSEYQKKAEDDASVLEELENSKSTLEAELATKNEEINTLTEKNESLSERVETAEKTLKDMELDKLAEDRLAELEAAAVLRSGDALDKQREVVRAQSDEEFASYKEELVAFKNEIIASLDKSEEGSKGDNTPAPEDDDLEDKEVDTPPADIEGAREQASSALPNAETGSVNSGWADFSSGMAKLLEKRREKDNK